MVDLTGVYEFMPMVTVDEFLQLNKLSKKSFRQKIKANGEASIKADFLRDCVICGYCNTKRQVSVTSKISAGTKRLYFYFRCDNRECSHYGKSDRANVIFQFVINFLDTHTFTSKSAYTHYIEEMRRITATKEKDLDSQRRSLHEQRKRLEEKIEKTKNFLLNEEESDIKTIFKNELKECSGALTMVNDQLEKNKLAMEKNKEAGLSYEQFLELFGKLPDILRQSKG